MICAAALLAPASGAAQTLDEGTAVRLGLARPAVTEFLKGSETVARGALRAAGRWTNPAFTYEREGTDGLSGPGTENFYRLRQVVDFSGQRGLEKRAARRRVQAAALEGESFRRDLAADIRRRFWELFHARRLEAASTRWASRLARIETVVARRKDAGEASDYALQRVRQAVAAAPAHTAEAIAAEEAATARLRARLGTEAATRLAQLKGHLLPPAPLPRAALLEAVEQRPDLRRMAEQVRAFDLDRKAAERSAIPDVTVGTGLRTTSIRNGEDDVGVLFNVTVPLPVFDRGHGAALEAGGKARATRARYRLALDDAHGEMLAVRARAERLRTAAEDYRADAMAPAETLLRIAEAAYEGGEIGILELLDAVKTRFETRRRLLELQLAARRAGIELDRLTGRGVE